MSVNCHHNHPRWSSRKLIILAAGTINYNLLLAVGAIDSEQLMEGLKWIFGAGLLAFGAEDGAKRFNPFKLK